jgi:hypothetical protein
MTTILPGPQDADETQARAWLPAVSTRNGNLALEHGMHQEIGWERRTDVSGMSVLFFSDNISNPVVEAMGHFAAGNAAAAEALFDNASGLLHAAGPDFSSTGMLATVERRLPGGNHVRLSYANGDALVMPVAVRGTGQVPGGLAQTMAAARPRHAQMYSLSLSGILEGSGTHWRASYRWQPEETVTRVAPYALDSTEPYLNLHIRQPFRVRLNGATRFEALLNMRNLLAQGYRPYVLSDGSLLVFAQEQRGFSGGVAFTF